MHKGNFNISESIGENWTLTEHLLSEIADNYEDARQYAKLSKERPEGHVKLNEQEKAEFEKWLGV